MTGATATPDAKQARRSPWLAASTMLVTGSFAVVALSYGFQPSAFVAPPAPNGKMGTLVAGAAAERMEVSRSDVEPRTQMHGKYPDRSGKNQQGGGRLPIRVNRNPVLGYSKAGENEPNARVLNRMFDMIDTDFARMTQQAKRYFRPMYRAKKWTADWKMRVGRKKKENRLKREFDEEWAQWMRSFGRRQGLTDPIIYKGPSIKEDPDEEYASMDAWKKMISVDVFKSRKNVGKGRDQLPYDIEPGKWDDGPESIHKIYKRPLHVHPYDIGKRGTKNVVVGIVM